ncbi:MAG: NlpC/P60 family protein [Parcubacteria group bacterium GW2011_GWA1_47_10]|nr:MAG: NlpC/P60 family protein [Parcubacteria group bacterium GW2011_GWA1_47_10]
MKLARLLILVALFFPLQATFAVAFAVEPVSASCAINSLLKIGSRGPEVGCLQGKLGIVTDGIFGPLTRASVAAFQSSKGLVADGIVGPLSRQAMLYDTNDSTTKNVSPGIPPPVYVPISEAKPPKVLSVSPEKVRSGDTVKIYGENFSSIGNTVRLRYAQIEARFENLPSSDGKLISFVFQPPEVKTMNKQELLNLPPTTLKKILDPVEEAGGSVDDILAPYRSIEDEAELRQFLQNNGHTFDELYDKFYVTVENAHGKGSSRTAILSGLRKLSLGSNSSLSNNDLISSVFLSLSKIFTPPKAYAQRAEGGYNSGVIMYCTCGTGYMTTMTDLSSNGGSGLYYWSPGFVPTVGNPLISGSQLGFFIQNSGTCVITTGNSCISITANVASLPWGEGL